MNANLTDDDSKCILKGSDSLRDVIVKMSEGIPGAIRVLMELAGLENGIFHILSLDDMGIRGSMIWVGYQDHCCEDLAAFARAIDARDQSMVDRINREFSYLTSTGSNPRRCGRNRFER